MRGIAFVPASSESWKRATLFDASGFDMKRSAGDLTSTRNRRPGSRVASHAIVRSLAGTPMSPPSMGVASKVASRCGSLRATGNWDA